MVTPTTLDLPALSVERVTIPSGTRFHGHGHAPAHFCFIERGAFLERGRRDPATAGATRLSPPGDQHDIRFVAETTCVLVLARPALLDGVRLPSGRAFVRVPAADRGFRRLGRMADGEAASPAALELCFLETVASLARGGDGPRPRWLERVRDLVLAAPETLPSSATLAAEAGLHPVYVARAFRRWYGCSITAYARRARLDRAYAMIVGSSEPLARVAAACGFADQSHLTRLMARHGGLPPARLREVAGVQARVRGARVA